MARDPATAKLIAQAAAKVGQTPKPGANCCHSVLGGLTGLVVVILMPVYLSTHTLEFLKITLAGSPDASAVEQFRAEK